MNANSYARNKVVRNNSIYTTNDQTNLSEFLVQNFSQYKLQIRTDNSQLTNSMIDRLEDLTYNLGPMANSHSQEQFSKDHQRQQAYQENEQQLEFGQKFAEEIKSVRSMIGGLNSNNKKIQTIKNTYQKAIKSAQQKQNSDEMNQILLENGVYQKKIKQKLKEIEAQVKLSQNNKPNQPETRMKRNFYLNLSKQVSQVLQKQQKFEQEYKLMVKDKVTRQVKLIDRELTEEQVQKYVNDPQSAQKMLQKKIYGQASIQLKNTVSDIQDKLKDIQKLQAAVNQCVQLFNQLSALVFAQGEKIDSIEVNVAECKDYIESAEKKLVQGKKHLECSKKCMCFIIIAALIVLIIIIIAVVATK